MVMIVERENIIFFKKTSPIFRRGLKCIFFTTKNLSEWRDNLNRDDSLELVHKREYMRSVLEVKNF